MSSSVQKSSVTFNNILGQGRKNQLGGYFINGRPLPVQTRVLIVEMAARGTKPCEISRQLQVSHGAVSKILNKFAQTGSISPGQIGGNPRSRLSIQSVEKHILVLKDENPEMSGAEIHASLIKQGICTRTNAPTVSSINRHLRARGLNLKRTATGCRSGHGAHHHKRHSPQPSQGARITHSIENILGTDESKSQSASLSSANSNFSEDENAGTRATPSVSSEAEGRRNRTAFTPQQLEILEKAFLEEIYPTPEKRMQLVRETQLCEEKINTWFSNRRARNRKSFGIGIGSPGELLMPALGVASPTMPMMPMPQLPLPPMFHHHPPTLLGPPNFTSIFAAANMMPPQPFLMNQFIFPSA